MKLLKPFEIFENVSKQKREHKKTRKREIIEEKQRKKEIRKDLLFWPE